MALCAGEVQSALWANTAQWLVPIAALGGGCTAQAQVMREPVQLRQSELLLLLRARNLRSAFATAAAIWSVLQTTLLLLPVRH